MKKNLYILYVQIGLVIVLLFFLVSIVIVKPESSSGQENRQTAITRIDLNEEKPGFFTRLFRPMYRLIFRGAPLEKTEDLCKDTLVILSDIQESNIVLVKTKDPQKIAKLNKDLQKNLQKLIKKQQQIQKLIPKMKQVKAEKPKCSKRADVQELLRNVFANPNLVQKSKPLVVEASGAISQQIEESQQIALNPFGMFCYHNRLDLVQSLGAKWIRYPVFWHNIQPKPNVWKWDFIEKGMDHFEQAGITVIPNIRTHQLKWATQCDGNERSETSCAPRDLNQYYTMINELTKHIKGRLNYFEIENEASSKFYFNGTVEDFLAIRRTAYKAVHDANPSGKIIDTGFAAGAWGVVVARDMYEQGRKQEAIDFIKGFMQNRDSRFEKMETQDQFEEYIYHPGPNRHYQFVTASFADGDSFDIAAVHFYEPTEYLKPVLDWVKNEMRKNGYQKPIWITEFGVKDKFNRIAPEEVAEQLTKRWNTALQEGVEVGIWFRASESCEPNEAAKVDEALFDREGNITPAGEAYKKLVDDMTVK